MKPSHPGETLRWLLLEEGILTDTAAEQAGLSSDQLRGLIEGNLSVTPETAKGLANLGGITAEMWLKMQVNFDQAR